MSLRYDFDDDYYNAYHEQQKELSHVCGNPDDYNYDAHEELSHTSNHVLYRKDSEKAKQDFSRIFSLLVQRREADDDGQQRDRLFYARRYYDFFNCMIHLFERFPGLKELEKDHESASKLWWYYRQKVDRLEREKKYREEHFDEIWDIDPDNPKCPHCNSCNVNTRSDDPEYLRGFLDYDDRQYLGYCRKCGAKGRILSKKERTVANAS